MRYLVCTGKSARLVSSQTPCTYSVRLADSGLCWPRTECPVGGVSWSSVVVWEGQGGSGTGKTGGRAKGCSGSWGNGAA